MFQLLAPYKVSSVTPVIVDAETTFIILNVNAQYNKNATTSSPSELEAKILVTLTDYNDITLQDFNSPFRHSTVTRLIDQSDTSILNSTATVTMGKLFTPNIGIEQSYSINFNNRIYHPHSNHASDMGGVISSTGFQLNAGSTFTENDEGIIREYFLDDNGRGEIRLYYLDAQTRVYNPKIAGTVDYHAGIVKLEPMDFAAVSNVDGLTSTRIRMTAITRFI